MQITGPRISVKKSVFFAMIFSVSNENEARAVVKDLKRRDRKANHVAFAFRIAGNAISEGMSDDGEPHGTAGLPLLMLLRNREMTNVLVAVTRYYGGVNLGPGNLARAYVEAAVKAIEEWSEKK